MSRAKSTMSVFAGGANSARAGLNRQITQCAIKWSPRVRLTGASRSNRRLQSIAPEIGSDGPCLLAHQALTINKKALALRGSKSQRSTTLQPTGGGRFHEGREVVAKLVLGTQARRMVYAYLAAC